MNSQVQLSSIVTSPQKKKGGKSADVSGQVSLNFSFAKVVAIYTVVAGHWFAGTVLWIPATFGLFVFSFSSAYFTHKIYGEKIDKKAFWKNKFERLWFRYSLTLLLLALLLLLEGRPVLNAASLVHFFGLSGLLNWGGLENRSALGAGLWFFTLLLIFYVVYPGLARLVRKKTPAVCVSLLAAFSALFLQTKVVVGHELWITALGFILGTAFSAHEPDIGAKSVALAFAASCLSLFLLNYSLQIKAFNVILIVLGSVSLSVWLARGSLSPIGPVAAVATLESFLLEIFIIHTYLFVHPFANTLLDFAASVSLVSFCALAIHATGMRLSRKIIKLRRAAENS